MIPRATFDNLNHWRQLILQWFRNWSFQHLFRAMRRWSLKSSRKRWKFCQGTQEYLVSHVPIKSIENENEESISIKIQFQHWHYFLTASNFYSIEHNSSPLLNVCTRCWTHEFIDSKTFFECLLQCFYSFKTFF